MSEEQNNSNESEERQSSPVEEFDIHKYFGFEPGESWESRETKIGTVLGITLYDMQEKVAEACVTSAEELSLQLTSIAQFGNYSKLIEDRSEMVNYLKNDCASPKAWKFSSVSSAEQLLKFEFRCLAIDGEPYFDEENPSYNSTLFGVVLVGKKSKEIRHYFVSVNDG